MQALEEHDSEGVTNVDEGIKIDDEESEPDHEGAGATEYPTQKLLTRSELQKR